MRRNPLCMRRALFPLLSIALGSLLLGAIRSPLRPRGAAGARNHIWLSSGSIARAFSRGAPSKLNDSLLIARRRLAQDKGGTYIDEVLAERDSAVVRWADRRSVPLTVWVQPRSSVRDFMPEYAARVRDAFVEWNSVRLPIGFSFVDDSASAEVHVSWIDHFDEQISGRTRWSHDDDWLINEADIVLAVHHSQGDRLEEDAMQAIALHEIGHLLGLDHTSDTLAVMAPRVRVRQLSDADRATARLLYSLPAGPVR
jgi:hypothetical protein